MNATLEKLSKYHPFTLGIIASLSLSISNGAISLIEVCTNISSIALSAGGFILWIGFLLLPGFLVMRQGNSTRIVLLVGALIGVVAGFFSFCWTLFLNISNNIYVNKVQNSFQSMSSRSQVEPTIHYNHGLVVAILLFGAFCVFLFHIVSSAGISLIGGLVGRFYKSRLEK